jgi:hypothetical protein
MSTRKERRHAAMMSRGSGRTVVLIAGAKRASGQVRLQHWTRSARLGRAAKWLAALWGLAVVSVAIPVAHFLLVPAFLIAGPIAAFRRLRQESGILGGEGTCPACGVQMVIEAHADEWPFFDVCQSCSTPARIEAAGAQG